MTELSRVGISSYTYTLHLTPYTYSLLLTPYSLLLLLLLLLLDQIIQNYKPKPIAAQGKTPRRSLKSAAPPLGSGGYEDASGR